MSTTLYQFAASPFTEKVARALNYKKIPFERVEVMPGGAEAHKDVSNSGKFPAINMDGVKIQDSTDILEHLDKVKPEPTIIPTDSAYKAYAHVIEEWADESLYFFEIVTTLLWEHNLKTRMPQFMGPLEGSGLTAEQVAPMLVAAMQPIAEHQGAGRKSKDQIIKELHRQFETLASLLNGSPFLVGTTLSNADLAVIGQLGALKYSQEVREIWSKYPQIDEWIARMDEIAPNN